LVGGQRRRRRNQQPLGDDLDARRDQLIQLRPDPVPVRQPRRA
jgi:hypothetical protein